MSLISQFHGWQRCEQHGEYKAVLSLTREGMKAFDGDFVLYWSKERVDFERFGFGRRWEHADRFFLDKANEGYPFSLAEQIKPIIGKSGFKLG